MKKIQLLIKKILINFPIVNLIFIFLNYKIKKTNIKIHNYTSHKMIMTKVNYQIYDTSNAGNVTGLDKDMNYEYSLSKKIIDLASKEKIFFDVGSAYGHYTWLASKLYGHVYCFEGDSLELFFLRKNCLNLNNVKIIERFVDNKYTLNNFCKLNNFYPDLVKIDVEGQEIDIIKNSEELLKNKSKFLIEFHKRKILKEKFNKKIIEDFFKIFEKYDYKVEFNGHHEASSLIENGISDKNWVKTNPETHNFAIFCYPKD